MTSPTRANHGHLASRWIKARASDNAYACVEVMSDDHHWHIRDSKHVLAGPVLTLDGPEWDQLCQVLLDAADEPSGLEREITIGSIRATVHPDGRLELAGLTSTEPSRVATLRYTPLEHDWFIDGLRNGEFSAVHVTAG
ncbi:MAG: DUF397 domain-containing protein [Pseudonocardia sp.]